MSIYTINRRGFITAGAAMAAAAAWRWIPGAFAEQLALTPRLTEGPFYPDRLPLDTDNDLLVINDSITPAVGTITHLSGRVMTASGEPVRNAVVEIWQVDANGAYIHSRSQNASRRDRNFQGYGRFETGSTGEYRFRTIRPVGYPGRAPHIHIAVQPPGRSKFITQCLIEGEPANARDNVLRGIRDNAARARVVVPFTPIPGSPVGELSAKFDMVLAG
jgi:protocatechuate 3,4-dioxygenase beta subunit